MPSHQSAAKIPNNVRLKDAERGNIFLKWIADKKQNALPKHQNMVAADPPEAHITQVCLPSIPRTMFQVEVSPPGRFIKVVSAIAESLRVVQLECTKRGLFVRTMDEAHVMFVELDLTYTFFTSFTSSSTFKVGVQLHEFSKFLKHITNHALLIMQYAEDEAGLQCSAFDTKGTTIRSFFPARLQIEAEEISLPALVYPITLTFATKSLHRVIECLGHFGATLYITIMSVTSLVFAAQSDGIAVRETINLGEVSACSGNISQTQVGSIFAYPLKYVNNILSVLGVADNTIVSFGTGVPLCIRFDLDSTSDSHLTYYIPEAVLLTSSIPTSVFTAP